MTNQPISTVPTALDLFPDSNNKKIFLKITASNIL